MLDLRLGDTNICNPLEGKMDALIETFVSVHGEESRDIITKRLNNAKFIFLPTANDSMTTLFTRYYYEALRASDKSRVGELAEQRKKIYAFFRDIENAEIKIGKKTEKEINLEVQRYLPALFDMSKQEFEYTYSTQERQDFVRIYLSLIERGKEHFADKMTLIPRQEEAFVKFFKSIGYDYGNDISNYAKDKSLVDLLFDEDVKSDITYIKERNEELMLKSNPFFQDAIKEIQSLDIKGGNLSMVEAVYQYMFNNHSVNACVITYMRNDQTSDAVCILPLAMNLSRITVLHECEHIVESCFTEDNSGKTISKVGFDVMNFELDELDYNGGNLDFDFGESRMGDRNAREFELISEVWNELFAHVLNGKADDFGFCVGDKTRKENWYVRAIRFLSGLDCYLDKILKARMSEDPNAFRNLFGKDIADELNKLVNSYIELSRRANYNAFKVSVERETGLSLTEIDFLNLPKGVKWSENDLLFIKRHQQMAMLEQKIDEKFSRKSNSPVSAEENA